MQKQPSAMVKKIVVKQKIKHTKVAAAKVITEMSENFEAVLVEAQAKNLAQYL